MAEPRYHDDGAGLALTVKELRLHLKPARQRRELAFQLFDGNAGFR